MYGTAAALILAIGLLGFGDQQPREYDWTVFHCCSEFPLPDPEGLHRELLDLRTNVAQTCGLSLQEAPVTLHLYGSRGRYIRFVSPIVPDARRQRGVYVCRDGQAAVYSFRQRNLEAILRHECVHAMLHGALPYVPLWLDEGLATYFEVPAASRAHGHPFESRIQWSLRFGWRPSLDSLEDIRRSDDMDAGDYRHAWAWVHFLLHESDESRAALLSYLQNIADGGPPRRFSQWIDDRLPNATQRFVDHFARLD